MSVRVRVFSGAAALWRRKKRRSSITDRTEDEETTAKGQSTLTSTPSASTACKLVTVSVRKDASVLEWDDIRGRAIYKSVGTTAREEDDTSDDDSFTEDKRKDQDESSLTGTEIATLAWDHPQDDQKRNTGRRARGTYRSTKRRIQPLDSTPSPCFTNDVPSNQAKKRRIDSKMNFSGKGAPEQETIINEEDSIGPITRRPRRRKSTTNVSSSTSLPIHVSGNVKSDTSEPEAGGNNKNKTPRIRVRRPSSQTSLSAVRTFFQQLDSNHQLNLETCDSEKKTVDGRTRRALTLKNPLISKEYRQYQRACRETDVEPLPLEGFLERRRGSSRRSIYDGFLDD